MRKFLRKYLPDADEIRSKRYISWFGGLLHHPNLWHLNRRSVAGAVAIGMFAGLIPGPLQMIGAALIAVPLKKNLPVALVTTFYTNPVTIVPLYVLAYGYGRLLLLWENHGEASIQPFEWDWANWLESTRAMFEWAVALGKPLAVGLVALALTLAALGYVAVQIGWRVYVMLAWRARCQRRAARS